MDYEYIKGKLIRIANTGLNYSGNIDQETSCTLTISRGLVTGAGEQARTSKHRASLRTWRLSGQCFLTAKQFKSVTFYMYDKNVQTSLVFMYEYDGKKRYLMGNAIFTSLNFSGQGLGAVRMNFEAKGNGRPNFVIQ